MPNQTGLAKDQTPRSVDVNRPVAGVFWMLVTGLLFVAVTAIVKFVGADLPPAEGAFIRYVLGLLFLLPMLPAIFRANISRNSYILFGFRGLIHSLAVILWFYAMTRITVAEVTAMNYMQPVYVTLGAALFLGEKLALRRISAIAVALIGAMIILRPGFRELNSGHFAMFFAAILFGGSYLSAKVLSGRFSPTVVVGMMSITVLLGLAPFAFAVWIPPTTAQVGWMFLVAAIATTGHYTMTLAFSMAPMSVTQPATFTQLIWATLLGATFFGEGIDGWVIFGAVIVMGAVSFIVLREAAIKRRENAPQ